MPRGISDRSRRGWGPGASAKKEDMVTIQAIGRAEGFRFALVVSKYHDFITDRLQAGALDALTAAGVAASDITLVRVPGAFEIPLAAQHAAESGRFDAVVSLGCVIRGETPHFDYICSAVAHGLTSASAATGVPIAFGVLTTNSVEEALARAGDGSGNKGREAAIAAIEMAEVIARLRTEAAPDEKRPRPRRAEGEAPATARAGGVAPAPVEKS